MEVKTWLMELRVYSRTCALEQMVQAASSSAGLRTVKRVEQILHDLGYSAPESMMYEEALALKPLNYFSPTIFGQ
ncbi:hypothetical protein WN944_029575 [Citrus x changshan-huyou]|uniref:Uncharacterized protein n=1 Tax=Citrus x changshan-huyou TaxID=2935761 RepID=A0AAP0LP47_9ROSI